MADEIQKVAVEIKTACYVGGKLVQPGDVVVMDETTATGEPFAALFGKVIRNKAAIAEAEAATPEVNQ